MTPEFRERLYPQQEGFAYFDKIRKRSHRDDSGVDVESKAPLSFGEERIEDSRERVVE